MSPPTSSPGSEARAQSQSASLSPPWSVCGKFRPQSQPTETYAQLQSFSKGEMGEKVLPADGNYCAIHVIIYEVGHHRLQP